MRNVQQGQNKQMSISLPHPVHSCLTSLPDREPRAKLGGGDLSAEQLQSAFHGHFGHQAAAAAGNPDQPEGERN